MSSIRPYLLFLLAVPFLHTHAQDVQSHAESLIARSRQLSDIRATNAPAFTLKADFSFTGEGLQTVHGTYTETWVSKTRWRRDVVVGDIHAITIGGVGKQWLTVPNGLPMQAEQLPLMMSAVPPDYGSLAFDFLRENHDQDLVVDCAFTKAPKNIERIAFCFDKGSGALLEKAFPERRPQSIILFSCEYGMFHKFGNYLFPRQIACFEDRHKTISADVVELTALSHPDPTLFEPRDDAVQVGSCQGKFDPPSVESSDWSAPDNPDRIAWLQVWFVVDETGKPQHVRLLRSSSSKLQDSAIKSLRDFHFKSATCDGQPIPFGMMMEVPATPK